MRILHIRDFANVARNLADAQTALGHPAGVLGRREPVLDLPDVELPAATDPVRAQLAILRHHRELRAADVLHIHGGIWRTELVWSFLRRARPDKIFAIHLHGSETRSGKGLHHLDVADRIFCSTPDLQRFVPGSQWLPNPVKVPGQPSGIPPGKPVIGHFPSHVSNKGTALIIAAFNSLGATAESSPEPGITHLENDAAVLLVVRTQPHARALQLMDGCAFVIDQVNELGAYGMVSVEAMARGKVVFSSYDPALYPDLPPIVRLTSDSLADTLGAWLQDHETWENRGRDGRAFVQRVHAAPRVAAQALHAYNQAAELSSARKAS